MVDQHHHNNFIKRTCLWSSSTRGAQDLVEMLAMLIHVYLILFYTTHLFVSGSTQSSHTCVNFAPPRIRSIWTAVSVVCLGNLRFSDCSHTGVLVPGFKCQDSSYFMVSNFFGVQHLLLLLFWTTGYPHFMELVVDKLNCLQSGNVQVVVTVFAFLLYLDVFHVLTTVILLF